MVESASDPAQDVQLDVQQALADLYERHFQAIYDFVLRTVRDPDAAADVVQNTFIKAWETMRAGTTPDNVKAWLFTVARNAAIDYFRRQSHFLPSRDTGGGADEALYLEVDPDRLSDPEAVLEDREMVELVWQAARTLSAKDYSLLDLHLRQGLTPDELADHLGARRGSVYMMLSRLKEALEEAVTCLLLIRRGRRECEVLDTLLASLEVNGLTKQTRRLVRKHVDGCDRCRQRSRRFVAPAEIFSSFALVPVSPELRAHIWDGIVQQLPPIPPGRQPRIGRSPALTRRLQRAVTASTSFLAAAAVAGALLAAGSSPLPARDPVDVHSTSHQIGQPSAQRIVTLAWSPRRDVRDYSIIWTHQPRDLPPARFGLPGNADQVASPPLADGDWYFHLRTEAPSGMWTHTVHVGPFVIRGEPNVSLSEQAATPSPIATGTPAEAASPTPAPEDTATAAPTVPTAPAAQVVPSPKATTLPGSAPPAPAPTAAGTTVLPTTEPAVSATVPPASPTSAPNATATPAPTLQHPTSTSTVSPPSPTATATPAATATPNCAATLAAVPGCSAPTPSPTPRIILPRRF